MSREYDHRMEAICIFVHLLAEELYDVLPYNTDFQIRGDIEDISKIIFLIPQ